MPSPKSDVDQLRFAALRNLMIDGAAKTLPDIFLEMSGANTREEMRERICESDSIMAVIESCTYVAMCIEEERKRVKS